MESSNFSSLIRMLELRLKRQRDAVRDTEWQLKEAREAVSSATPAANKPKV